MTTLCAGTFLDWGGPRIVGAVMLACLAPLARGGEAGAGESAPWHQAVAPLMTRWAAEVSPTNALPEYPRPQLVRPEWLNLNGLWDYAITPAATDNAPAFEGQILVPFPVESALSGVMRRLDEKSKLWYRRRFTLPSPWTGRRVRLHFGAVDWQARVLVNGKEIGQHRGGYDDFSFEVTDSLNSTGQQELIVAVTDPTEGDQPRGKQSRKPEGIFYTPCSGIWQTVWLEPVPETCIDELSLVPDLDASALRLRVGVNSLDESVRVEAIASSSSREVGHVTGLANQELRLALPSPHLWSPDDPFLYDLRITLKQGERVCETVTSYFGMRKIGLRKDGDGVTRIALNDRVLFQVGTLDQGFWPDGIYTAPTDAALRYDIEFLKQAGFNLARKHVKVEPDRWYYWCDKLGLLVWQDMPSANNSTPEGRTRFEAELQRMLEGRRNHPSIILWILFNEGWGQYDTERLTQWLKALDPSRLVTDASGWTDKRVGDIIDRHSYPGPESPSPEAERAAVLGEFGGLGLGVDEHTWSKRFWGYQSMKDRQALTDRYSSLLGRLWTLKDSGGLSAAVYTQTTDVETECNGLMTYDRAVCKLDLPQVRAANRGESREHRFRVIVSDALYGRPSWRYTTEKPDAAWFRPGFNASGWKEGAAGFGTDQTPGALVHTVWNSDDIYLRREFVLNHEDLSKARLQLHHDEDVEIYLNGVLAGTAAGFVTEYYEMDISPEAAATLKSGVNLLAVHCHQTTGGQYIDVGIVAPPLAGTAALRK
ncbi:MAG TPA: glycoside hydrolase family 2 TIM barrel-domain containing protein [Candidatus Acidoferrum sp.]|nr:glycoside hydrolase family 2 TIM barrel-domain containing protein [Candidatus Acidoferrum sp.]